MSLHHSCVPGERERLTYESRVHESDGGFPGFETLIVNACQDRGEHRARGTSASDDVRQAFVEDDDVIADCCDVGVATAGAVVCFRWWLVCGEGQHQGIHAWKTGWDGIRTNARTIAAARVRLVRGRRSLEVGRNSGSLV